MKFNLQKFLANPERYTFKNGYGSSLTYVAHCTEAEKQGLVMLRDNDKSIELFDLDGSYAPGSISGLDLTMEEKPLEIVFEGMAYVSEAGAVVGVQVQDNGPHRLSNVSAHKCRVIVTREPELTSNVVTL